jgi:signal peptidase I
MGDIQVNYSPYYYYGNSMAGTFKPGDCLTVESAFWENIKPGDIVIFSTMNNEKVVHRVLAIKDEGLITCGDNNFDCDLEPVSPDHLLGIIKQVERGNKIYYVAGGEIGLLKFILLQCLNRTLKLTKIVCRYPYQLAKQQIKLLLKRVWHPEIIRVTLTVDQGRVIKYLYKGRTIAIWWTEKHIFECQKPFDLVVSNPEEGKET